MHTQDAFPLHLHWDAQQLTDAVPLRLHPLLSFDANRGDAGRASTQASNAHRLTPSRGRHAPGCYAAQAALPALFSIR